MKKHEVHFKTLTPLWTGGVGRNSDQARETGLIGSLRWWYEGIVRGMGGYACDPVGDGRCEFKAKDKHPPEEQLCPACHLFGCTGWQRRFRLEVEGLEPQALFFVASRNVYTAAGNWLWRIFDGGDLGGTKPKKEDVEKIFRFVAKALWAEQAALRILPLEDEGEGTLARIAFLVDTMADWGALGAKPQHGFGQIQIDGDLNWDKKGPDLIVEDIQRYGKKSAPVGDVFNLVSFFSHIYHVSPTTRYLENLREIGAPPAGFEYQKHFIPCAFDIRYRSRSKDLRGRGENFGMRPWFREWLGQVEIHKQFGRSGEHIPEDQRSASRVFVSHLYRVESDGPWYLKVWGHVPSDLQDDLGNPISVNDVAGQVTAFVQTMFPGSLLVDEFKRKEVLGR